MIPILVSLLGLAVISICIFVFYKTGGAWFNRRFLEALVKDVRGARKAKEAKDAQSSDSKDSIG